MGTGGAGKRGRGGDYLSSSYHIRALRLTHINSGCKMLKIGGLFMQVRGLVVTGAENRGHLIWIENGNSAAYTDQANYC